MLSASPPQPTPITPLNSLITSLSLCSRHAGYSSVPRTEQTPSCHCTKCALWLQLTPRWPEDASLIFFLLNWICSVRPSLNSLFKTSPPLPDTLYFSLLHFYPQQFSLPNKPHIFFICPSYYLLPPPEYIFHHNRHFCLFCLFIYFCIPRA